MGESIFVSLVSLVSTKIDSAKSRRYIKINSVGKEKKPNI